MHKLKYHSTDVGFCKVMFTFTPEKGGKPYYYCVLDDGYSGHPNPVLMACSSDGEPSHEVKMKKGVTFEDPPCGSEIAQIARDYLNELGLLETKKGKKQ